jgi:probable FeS assembly SUF system protein SufT
VSQVIEVRRDILGTRIPHGDFFRLLAGTQVELVQMLGGNFTVGTPEGRLLRVDGKDADALGLEGMVPEAGKSAPASGGPVEREQVLEVLRTVFDPEIPINVVDLGLIYRCEISDAPSGKRVEVEMSMTAPGCGMGDVLREDVQAKLQALPGVDEVAVEIVWDPPWDSSRMSDEAKLQLGWL